ncbi:MAG: GNAT family N-acetyltransferase [Planctomycetota bacterium]
MSATDRSATRAVAVLPPDGAGPAQDADVPGITRLVNLWAETGLTLHRREAEVRAHLGQFVVARSGTRTGGGADSQSDVAGCAAVSVVVPGLAEVRSVVVDPDRKGTGVSRVVMAAVLDRAVTLGVDELVLLTKQPGFFSKFGFESVDPMRLPAAFVQRVVLEPGRSFVERTAMRRVTAAVGTVSA